MWALTNKSLGLYWASTYFRGLNFTPTLEQPQAMNWFRRGEAVPTEEDKSSAKVQGLGQREFVIALNDALDDGRGTQGRETDRRIHIAKRRGAASSRIERLVAHVPSWIAKDLIRSNGYNDFAGWRVYRKIYGCGPTVIGKDICPELPAAAHILNCAIGKFNLDTEIYKGSIHRFGESQIDQNRAGSRIPQRARKLYE